MSEPKFEYLPINRVENDRDSWRRVAEQLEAEKVELVEALRELRQDFMKAVFATDWRDRTAFNRAAELLRKHGGRGDGRLRRRL